MVAFDSKRCTITIIIINTITINDWDGCSDVAKPIDLGQSYGRVGGGRDDEIGSDAAE